MFWSLGCLLENYKKENSEGMLGQIMEILESQAEKYVLNFDGSVNCWRCLNVGTEKALEKVVWWWA